MAHGGILANIGAKKIEIKKHMPVVIAVSPVRPPSAIPAPDSINAVTGLVPITLPMVILIASVQYASVERGKSPVADNYGGFDFVHHEKCRDDATTRKSNP